MTLPQVPRRRRRHPERANLRIHGVQRGVRARERGPAFPRVVSHRSPSSPNRSSLAFERRVSRTRSRSRVSRPSRTRTRARSPPTRSRRIEAARAGTSRSDASRASRCRDNGWERHPKRVTRPRAATRVATCRAGTVVTRPAMIRARARPNPRAGSTPRRSGTTRSEIEPPALEPASRARPRRAPRVGTGEGVWTTWTRCSLENRRDCVGTRPRNWR